MIRFLLLPLTNLLGRGRRPKINPIRIRRTKCVNERLKFMLLHANTAPKRGDRLHEVNSSASQAHQCVAHFTPDGASCFARCRVLCLTPTRQVLGQTGLRKLVFGGCGGIGGGCDDGLHCGGSGGVPARLGDVYLWAGRPRRPRAQGRACSARRGRPPCSAARLSAAWSATHLQGSGMSAVLGGHGGRGSVAAAWPAARCLGWGGAATCLQCSATSAVLGASMAAPPWRLLHGGRGSTVLGGGNHVGGHFAAPPRAHHAIPIIVRAQDDVVIDAGHGCCSETAICVLFSISLKNDISTTNRKQTKN